MSCLVLRLIKDTMFRNRYVRTFELGINNPHGVDALMSDNSVEQVFYSVQTQKLEDAVNAAVVVADRHGYLVDEILIQGWKP